MSFLQLLLRSFLELFLSASWSDVSSWRWYSTGHLFDHACRRFTLCSRFSQLRHLTSLGADSPSKTFSCPAKVSCKSNITVGLRSLDESCFRSRHCGNSSPHSTYAKFQWCSHDMRRILSAKCLHASGHFADLKKRREELRREKTRTRNQREGRLAAAVSAVLFLEKKGSRGKSNVQTQWHTTCTLGRPDRARTDLCREGIESCRTLIFRSASRPVSSVPELVRLVPMRA